MHYMNTTYCSLTKMPELPPSDTFITIADNLSNLSWEKALLGTDRKAKTR